MTKLTSKRGIGFLAGIAVLALVLVAPLNALGEISAQGQTCLALTLMTVVWWACGVAQPAFVSAIYLALLMLTGAADGATVFKSWTGLTMWMVIGAYLIATAVKDSRLGERIAYWFSLKFVRDWNSLVVSIFALTMILSLLIPHPFPRAFMILAVMQAICDAAGMSKADKVKVGFLTFAAAAPGSMFFLTGDATLNPLVVADAGVECTFVEWFIYMSVPMLVATAATLGLGLVLFKPESEFELDLDVVRARQEELGPVSVTEKRVVVWLVIAVALWMTEGLTGLNIGFVTLIIGAAMAIGTVAGTGISPLAVSMMVFSAINIHYILPFHNLAVLVGSGEDAAGYSSKEAMRMGIPLTAVVFVVVLVEAVWFHAMGLM